MVEIAVIKRTFNGNEGREWESVACGKEWWDSICNFSSKYSDAVVKLGSGAMYFTCGEPEFEQIEPNLIFSH